MNNVDYNTMMKKDKEYIWHPFTQMKQWLADDQLIISSGDGNTLYDIEGKPYLDAYGSLWCNVHGHNIPELNKAIIEQVKKISHSTMLGASNVPAILLAEKLIEIAPEGLKKVFYADSGSEAMEIALKIAYQYWKQVHNKERTKFISFESAYHGDTIGSVSVGGIPLFHEIFKDLLFETIKVPNTYAYRMKNEMTLEECGNYVIGKIEEALKLNADNIIGIVIEPKIFGASGMIVQPDGFVNKLRKLADNYDTLLICDEVATGFGRTGEMFACLSEASPDIMAVAKGISGGYLPISATLVTEKIFNAFLGEYNEYKTFYHGHTYTGNQLACAVSIANIDLMKKNNTIKHVKQISDFLSKKLEQLEDRSEYVGEVRQRGIMAGIELVKDKKTKKSFPPENLLGHKIAMNCRKYGVLTRNLQDIIVLNPPLSIKNNEIEIIINAIEKSVHEAVSSL